METARERADALIDQCAMWCVHTNREPFKTPTNDVERNMLLMAIHQNKRTFQQLNSRQRQLIAGIPKSLEARHGKGSIPHATG